jgi:hypothetical protein
MIFYRSIRRFAAIAAAFAISLQALWPLLSHARPKDPSLLVPVCTIDGITHYLEIKSGKTPLDERSSLHSDHCKLCVFGDGKSAAVLRLDFSAFLLVRNTDRASRPAAASHEPPLLIPAQPRAPPQVS